MDTNLKKSKLIKAFIYRLIMVSSLVTMIASGIFGREALVNLVKEGSGTLTGDMYYLTEMRQYMANLFQNYMISHVGVADDMGYPLTDGSASRYELECGQNFEAGMKQLHTTVVYQYQELHKNNSQIITAQYGSIDFPLYSENDGHLLETDDFRMVIYWDGPLGQLRFFNKVYNVPSPGSEYLTQANYGTQWEEASNTRFVLGYRENDGYVNNDFQTMYDTAQGYRIVLLLFFCSATLLIVSGILSLFSGRKFAAAASTYSTYSRKVLLEIKLLILAITISIWLDNWLNCTAASLESRIYIYPRLWLYYPIVLILYLFWLDIRIGGTACLKNSIVYKTTQLLKEWNTSIHWKKKMLSICLIIACSAIANIGLIYLLVCFSGFYIRGSFTLLAIGLGILFALQCISVSKLYNFIRDTAILLEKVECLRMGQSTKEMKLSRKTLLAESDTALSELENGMERAIEQENKSNRMRVELITNVSHDLKTPLTSIINYADLLSEENLEAPAGEYVEALRSKAYRLKKMVQDVFELSKATTGNLPVENNKLDFAKLIRQTLADMDEELQKSTLQFRLKISNEPLFIMADGEKMYRVFQNLLVNAMQYSLPGSRVYISLKKQDGYAIAQMKNVSLEEMNFDPEEIVERFARADASRTKEGSGLGLSIAQSFTQACGGEFFVGIDADLFTATVRFPLISDEEGNINAHTSEEI